MAGFPSRPVFVLSALGFAALTLLLFPPAAASTSVGPATLASDTTWDLAGSPYFVEGNVIIAGSATLTVDAGVEVRFNGPFEIVVNGGLIVAGNETAVVAFDANVSGGATSWGRLFFVGTQIPSAVDHASIHNATTAIEVAVHAAPINLSNISIGRASAFAMRIYASLTNVSVVNLTVRDSHDGVFINNSRGVSIVGYHAENLTGVNPYALVATRSVSELYFAGLDFPGSRLRIAQYLDVLVVGVYVSSLTLPIGIDISNGTNLTLNDARIDGFTVEGLLVNNGLIFSANSVDVSPLANVSAARATTFVLSPKFSLANASLLGSATGVSADRSTTYTLDNVTVTNASSAGLNFADSGLGSVVKNVELVNVTLGVWMANSTLSGYDIDFTLNNKVNGRPILCIYNTPAVVVIPADTYGWLLVWASPSASVNGLNIMQDGGQPAAVWANSPSGSIVNSRIRSVNTGLLLLASDLTTITGSDILGDGTGAIVRNSTLVTVSDSVFWGGGSYGLWLDRVNDSGFVNITAFGNYRSLFDYVGFRNVFSLSRFNGTAEIFQTAGDAVDHSSFCDGPPMVDGGLKLASSTGTLLRENTFCAGKTAISLSGGNRHVIENTTFLNVTSGILLTGSSFNTIRWNEFRGASQYGISISGGGSNVIYENNFFGNFFSGSEGFASSNTWYNLSKGRGNYWDDYTGVDSNGDLIGDTPKAIPGGPKQDIFPLIVPFDRIRPVAVPFAEYGINEDTPAPLDGSNSTDNTAVTRGYWILWDGVAVYNLSGIYVNHSFPTPGRWLVELHVFDVWNNSDVAQTYVNIWDTTAPYFFEPVGPFVFDEDVDSLMGAAVADNDPEFPNGATFHWTLEGPGINITVDTPRAILKYNFTEPGRYNGSLTAYDAFGNNVGSPFTVRVNDRTPPAFSFVRTGPDPPAAGDTTRLEMRFGNDNDPAFPSPDAYHYVIVFPNGSTAQFWNTTINFTVPEPGNYSIRYEARDPSGNVAGGYYNFTARDVQGPQWTPPIGLFVNESANLTLSVEDATDFSGVAEAVWRDAGRSIGSGVNISLAFSGLGDHALAVTLTDNLGNDALYTFTLTVRDGTPPRLSTPAFGASHTLKQQQPLELDGWNKFADNDPDFPATGRYVWSTDAPDVTWGSPRDRPLAILQFNATGSFTLTLTVADAAGNTVVLRIPVNVTDGLPPTGITWTVLPNITAKIGTVFTFTASATDPSGVFITWFFGDGSTGDGATVSYDYPAVGRYQAKLLVEDGAGNEAHIFFNITVVDITPGGSPGPNNGGGGGGGGGGGSLDAVVTVLLIAAVLVVGGIIAMYAVFRRKFKPQPPQEVIIQEEPPAYSYGEQPGYLESPYGGGGYDPYAQTRQPPRPPSR